MKGDFTLDRNIVSVSLRTICRAGMTVRIEPRAMRVLEILAQQPGQVVSKASLIQAVWGHTHVTDDVLTRCISCLRKALDDSAREPRIIQTIPKAGYRLIGAINWMQEDPAPVPMPQAQAAPRLPALRSDGNPRHTSKGTRLLGAITALVFAAGAMLGTAYVFETKVSTPGYGQMSGHFGGGGRDSGSGHNADSGAYRFYMLGRYYWNKRTQAGLDRAVSLFQRALSLDPRYASAWAALADVYNVMPDWGALSPGEAFPRARAAALRALQLDPTSAEAHAALAYTIGNYDWNWSEAEREFHTALQLNPGYPSAHQWYAMQLAALGRFAQARAEISKAEQLDPVSAVIGTDAAEILYASGLNDAAIEKFREVIALDVNFPQAHAGLARVYERLGRYDDAVDELGKAAESTGDRTFSAQLSGAYSRSGYAGALKELITHELRGRVGDHYGSAAEIARLYTALGERRDALDWLEKARDDRDSCMVFMTAASEFDTIRQDARFVRLLDATGRPRS